MPTITIDSTAGITIDSDVYFNECRTLKMMTAGLFQIANFLKRRERVWEQQCGGKLKATWYGMDFDGTTDALDLIACMFHWFGVSVCNYARLVGFIRGASTGAFNRADLCDPQKMEAIHSSVVAYLKSVPEIADVLIWRNKVAAHFAITAPHKTDNIATLDLSVMFPVSFTDDRYTVGDFVLTRKNSVGAFTSELPGWSVTEVFEQLIPRYWPNVVLKEAAAAASQPQ